MVNKHSETPKILTEYSDDQLRKELKRRRNLTKELKSEKKREAAETLKSNTQRLEELGFSIDECKRESIDKIEINFKHLQTLIEWGFFPKDKEWKISDLDSDDLEWIQKHFKLLSKLHKKWLKMTSGILFLLWEVDVDREQVQRLSSHNVEVSNSSWLIREFLYKFPWGPLQWFKDIWHPLDRFEIEDLMKNIYNINFKELQRLENLIWDRIVLQDITDKMKGDIPWLDSCQWMPYFDREWVEFLVKNHIPIFKRLLGRFRKTRVNTTNFQYFLDNNIKIPDKDLYRWLPAFIDIQNWTMTCKDLTGFYLKNHPETTDDAYTIRDRISEKYSNKKSFTIEEFIEAYREIEELFNS